MINAYDVDIINKYGPQNPRILRNKFIYILYIFNIDIVLQLSYKMTNHYHLNLMYPLYQ